MAALQSLPGYAPANPAFSVESLLVIQRETWAAIELTQSMRTDLAAVYADEIAKTNKLHEGIQQAKLAVQVIGLKRQVDYKRPQRKKDALDTKA